MFKVINSKISYIECTHNPLSADVGIVSNGQDIWLFDVGMDENRLSTFQGKCNIVLSHFHEDHTGCIQKMEAKELYSSKYTFRHIGKGNIIDSDLYFGGIHLFLLPSSHAKGCVGMEVNEEYAFVGDALYCRVSDCEKIYNSQLLREEIAVLKNLKAPYLLVSHKEGLIEDRLKAIDELEKIYALRDKNLSEIRIPFTENE